MSRMSFDSKHCGSGAKQRRRGVGRWLLRSRGMWWGERMKGWVVKQLYSLLESEIAIAIAVWV